MMNESACSKLVAMIILADGMLMVIEPIVRQPSALAARALMHVSLVELFLHLIHATAADHAPAAVKPALQAAAFCALASWSARTESTFASAALSAATCLTCCWFLRGIKPEGRRLANENVRG